MNACEGIETVVLEMDKPQFVKMLNEGTAAMRQRDELLAAMGKIASPTQSDGLLWWQIEAREALAKVGAGTTATEGHNLNSTTPDVA